MDAYSVGPASVEIFVLCVYRYHADFTEHALYFRVSYFSLNL